MTDKGPFEQNRNQGGKRIVFGALDWGLGHATRSVPLLRYIQQKGGQISIAASGPTAELLKNECPEAEFLDLPGYGITYPGQGQSFRTHILKQGPSIRKSIKREGLWLLEAQQNHRWDLIISDNRYGFQIPGVPSIFITHQLSPISGLGKMADRLFQRFLYYYINRFTECWVPDLEVEPSLAAKLSHPQHPPRVAVRYIGLLSRLEPVPNPEPQSDVLFLLSGPEPQRSLLEQRILSQWAGLPGRKTMVRGLPGSKDTTHPLGDTHIFNHLDAAQLSREMAGAGLVVCRPGYSSLMDLLRLNKKALLIPTPGQTEQEYLAQQCKAMGGFHAVGQDALELVRDIANVQASGMHFPASAFDLFKKAVDAFVF